MEASKEFATMLATMEARKQASKTRNQANKKGKNTNKHVGSVLATNKAKNAIKLQEYVPLAKQERKLADHKVNLKEYGRKQRSKTKKYNSVGKLESKPKNCNNTSYLESKRASEQKGTK